MVLSKEFYYEEIQLDTVNERFNKVPTAKEGDANGRGLLITLTENGLVKNTTGVNLFFKWEHTAISGAQGIEAFEIEDLTKGKYLITYPAEMNHEGYVKAEVRIIDNGKYAGSRNIKIYVEPSVGDDTAIESSNQFSALVTALLEVNSWNDRIDAVEQEFIDKANNLDATYPTRLLSAEQQLAENTTLVDTNSKQIKGINKKIPTIPTPLKTLEKFDNELFNFDHTKGIKVIDGSVAGTKQLTIDSTTDQPNHTNVAVYNTINNVRGYEIEIEPTTDITKLRIGFANSINDFTFINFATGEYYLLNGGALTITLNNPLTPITFVAGDKVKIISYDMTILVFKNGVLVGIVKPQPSYTTRRLENKGKNHPAVSFRSGVAPDIYGVNKLKVYQKTYPKFMHFSYDDEIELLQRLTTTLPVSIFNMDTFAFMKSMHDTYGAVFTINLFYKYNDVFTLANVTANYLNEFRANSDWLKFGFHGYDGIVDYATLDSATAKTHYDNIVTEIARFASPQCIDTMPRASMFGGNLATVRAWRDTANYNITGLLSADDTRNSYYHSTLQRDALVACDDLFDAVEGLFFMRTDLRLDSATGVYTTLDARKADMAYRGQQEAHIIFWHAGWTWGAQLKLNIEDSCKWARDNGYAFLFPMDVNPKF